MTGFWPSYFHALESSAENMQSARVVWGTQNSSCAPMSTKKAVAPTLLLAACKMSLTALVCNPDGLLRTATCFVLRQCLHGISGMQCGHCDTAVRARCVRRSTSEISFMQERTHRLNRGDGWAGCQESGPGGALAVQNSSLDLIFRWA